MKVIVVGVGAIGGWLAGAFAAAGAEVSLFARGAVATALEADGLRVRRAGVEKVYRLPLLDGSTERGADLILIAVKGHSVPQVTRAVVGLCGPETALLPALNGLPWWFFRRPGIPLAGTQLASVDPHGVASGGLDPHRVIGCVVHASVTAPQPAVSDVRGEDRLILGEPAGIDSPRVRTLCELLRPTGINPVMSANIRLEIWTKLWGNMTLNPLSVLTGAGTGDILDDPDASGLVRAMMLEMQTLGDRLGLKLEMEPEERMAVTRRLGNFKTSMLQDALAGRALETGPILGALVEIAEALDHPVPFIRAVHGLMSVRARPDECQSTDARRLTGSCQGGESGE